jgi:hypothetical protein
MYALLLDLVSARHPDTAGNPHQLSLAQGRLLRILPRLASLNFVAVARSSLPTPPPPAHLTNGSHSITTNGDSEQSHPPPPPNNPPRQGEGLLHYAALRMVDPSDVLMHLSLVDFFEALVSLLRVTEHVPHKVSALRALLAEATARDAALRDALLSLPDRTVEEESEGLRGWLAEVMPREGGVVDGGLPLR